MFFSGEDMLTEDGYSDFEVCRDMISALINLTAVCIIEAFSFSVSCVHDLL